MRLRSRHTVVVVAMVVAIAVLAGCGAAGSETVANDTGTAPSDRSEPPRPLTPEEVERAGGDGFPVLDEKGDVRGTITQAELDAQDDRVNAHLLVDGTGVGDVAPRYREVSPEVALAYQVLEAIEVRDGDEVVGYWTSNFVPAEELPAERARAEAVVAGAAG